jgi:RIO kinase 1
VAERDENSKIRERLLRSERENRYLRKDSDQRKSVEEVFDRATLLAVEELVKRRVLSDLYGVVRSGKEARVYYGKGLEGEPVAVKIYLTSTSEFRKRIEYIAGDRRFGRLPSNSRDAIFVWVRKEFRNLQLADSVGVRVPRPVAFYRNILVMEYVGNPPDPAPTFAETEVNEADYDWTFNTIETLYKKGRLVHADLSEFNIFKNGEARVLFDMGSAVIASHPQSEAFLRRDITNMVRFFNKRGIFVRDADAWVKETLS